MEATPQLVSKEMIKPSSKTPNYFRKFKLSYLDQLVVPTYIPLVFFYDAGDLKNSTSDTKGTHISENLKQSLSKTLTTFYPLAGRLHQECFMIDCNDLGCEYTEARVGACISDVIKDPDMDQLKRYLPLDPLGGDDNDTILLVQITFFDCGGIAIGLCMSHIVGDGTSLLSFIKTWANIFRTGEITQDSQPIFSLGNLFPARDFSGYDFTASLVMDTSENIITKRFIFDEEKLALLKQVVTSSGESLVKDPTRVEVISSFIWKNYIETTRLKHLDRDMKFCAFHIVNLRSRTNPRDVNLDNIFGNCFMTSHAYTEGEPEFHDLGSKLRNAIIRINNEYIIESLNGDSHVNDLAKALTFLSKGEKKLFTFTSWSRFPFYEVDYGWGKPIWVCTTTMPVNNLAILMGMRSGDGIEAWVNMTPHDMLALETEFNNLGTK